MNISYAPHDNIFLFYFISFHFLAFLQLIKKPVSITYFDHVTAMAKTNSAT